MTPIALCRIPRHVLGLSSPFLLSVRVGLIGATPLRHQSIEQCLKCVVDAGEFPFVPSHPETRFSLPRFQCPQASETQLVAPIRNALSRVSLSYSSESVELPSTNIVYDPEALPPDPKLQGCVNIPWCELEETLVEQDRAAPAHTKNDTPPGTMIWKGGVTREGAREGGREGGRRNGIFRG